MCGIGGFKGPMFAQLKEKTLHSLGEALKSRGEMATGIGFYNSSNAPKILKAAVAPSKVDWSTLFAFSPCKSDTVIFHNRYATHGKPEINKNNHPFNGEGYLLAHNGVLTNYKTLLKEYDITISEKEPETDSYSLVKILNKIMANGKTLVEALKELCPKVIGSMVLTILTKDNELILVRGSKYSYKLYQINDKNYLYASAANNKGSKEHIDLALEPLWLDLIHNTKGDFSVKDIQIPEYSITIIDAEGNLSVELFEKPKSTQAPSYSSFPVPNLTPKNASSYRGGYGNYYYGYGNYNPGTTLFDAEPINLEDRRVRGFINDVMDELQDVWERYTKTKFDYEYVRSFIEDEIVAFGSYQDLVDAYSSPRLFANSLLESGFIENFN